MGNKKVDHPENMITNRHTFTTSRGNQFTCKDCLTLHDLCRIEARAMTYLFPDTPAELAYVMIRGRTCFAYKAAEMSVLLIDAPDSWKIPNPLGDDHPKLIEPGIVSNTDPASWDEFKEVYEVITDHLNRFRENKPNRLDAPLSESESTS